MMNIILLFFPAIFSIVVDKKINNFENDKNTLLVKYVTYTFFILLCSTFTTFIVVGADSSWYTNIDSLTFIMKYLMLSFFYAVVLPVIFKFLKRNFEIKISISKESEK